MTPWEKRSDRWLWWSFSKRMPCRDFATNLGAGFMPRGHSRRWLVFHSGPSWRYQYKHKFLHSHRITIG